MIKLHIRRTLFEIDKSIQPQTKNIKQNLDTIIYEEA